MIYPFPRGGLLGERPVPGGRERTEREEQLQRQSEDVAAQGPVVKAKKAPSAPSLVEWDGHLGAGHAEYRGGVHSALLAKERVKLIDGLKHHETMGIQNFIWITLSWAEEPRTQRWLITHPVPCEGTQHRWIIGKLVNDVVMSGVQTLVVKSDQEASIVDVKNALMRELRGFLGLTVMPEESPVGASAARVGDAEHHESDCCVR